VVQELLALNGGRWRDRVEVWDWRILLEGREGDEHAGGVSGEVRIRGNAFGGGVGIDGEGLEVGREGIGKCFIGATVWDEGRDRAMFVRRE